MTSSPSTTKRSAFSRARPALTSGKKRLSDFCFFDCRSTLSPSRKAMQRKPSYLGSNSQPLPREFRESSCGVCCLAVSAQISLAFLNRS